jgi:hypothetical protein
MKRWILVVLIALALVVIVGFTQIKLDALQEPGPVETFLATQVKHLPGSPEQPPGYSPSANEFAGEYRGRGQNLRHRMFNVSWPRRHTH